MLDEGKRAGKSASDEFPNADLDQRQGGHEPEHDERKKGGFRWITALGLAALVAGYTKRFRWANLKARKITYQF